MAAVAVILMLAGNAFAIPREGRDQARGRTREQGIVKIVKKIIRALGDGLIVPLP
ncbi:MAG TPA: hypothetical protein VF432_23940 [Thermoanaerobaculia bacterium]